MENPLYVCNFVKANILGPYIKQNPITQDSCKQNPYEFKLGALYEKINFEIILM